MRIAVTGTRGIPGIQGGVETHCQNLYREIAGMGHDVTIFRRKPYTAQSAGLKQYGQIRLKDIYAPRKKSVEAIVHTLLSVLKARGERPDILHIHAIGPAILTPLAKLMGMRVVMTHHGHDYERSKWGRTAKAVLRFGERMGCRYADRIIAVSGHIARNVASLYGRTDVVTIENGVDKPSRCQETEFIESLGLKRGRYVIALGRLVKEKEFDTLLDAWEMAGNETGMQLVIAGDADHDDEYSRGLRQRGKALGVVMPGFVTGAPLNQLMSHAALFVMPSSHEGLPIALLEAMSYGLDVAVSDIAACRLPELNDEDYFECGDTDGLVSLIRRKTANRTTSRQYDMGRYDWSDIARRTEAVYRSVMKSEPPE